MGRDGARHAISRLEAEVLSCPKSRRGFEKIVKIIESSALRPAMKLRAANAAIFGGYVVELEKLPSPPPEAPDLSQFSWLRRYFVQRKHLEVLAQFELGLTVNRACNLSKHVDVWHSATGPEFEELVAHKLHESGFHVEICGGSGDRGIDLIARKDGKLVVVQCKAHSKRVSPHAIRDFYGALLDSSARCGIFASRLGVSQKSIEWAHGKPIIFLDTNDFIEMQHPIFR